MNLIVAIFVYLGLTSIENPVITQEDMVTYSAEIQRTASDPGFYDFYEESCSAPGIFVMDLDEH